MKALYDVPAPAKLNTFLHITGRRADGYHLLQSVFMLVDWCDTLHFDVRTDGSISREDLTTPLPADDLVIRAAKALQQFTQCPLGVHIGIAKSIPAQAGMGGGSFYAASTLLALNRLWQLNLPLSALAQIGLQLGADVPFFLGGRNAWVEGIGEKITPIDLPSAAFVVVKPDAGLETRLIFSDAMLKRDSKFATMRDFAANTFEFGQNNLQQVAEKICPDVSHALGWLKSQGLQGRMTGSGSAVFAKLLHTVDTASAPVGMQVRICNNLPSHPLMDWVGSDVKKVNGG